jgi:hypothetical protein
MEALVWIFAGIFVLNISIVALSAHLAEDQRRREEREIRELEALWRSPASSSRTVRGSRTRLRIRGRHVATTIRESERLGPMRRATFALALASLVGAMVAVLVDPQAGRPAMSAQEHLVPALPTASNHPRLLDRDDRGEVSVDDGVAGDEAAMPGLDPSITSVATSDSKLVSALVAAEPSSATAIRLEWAEVPAAMGYAVERWDGPTETPGTWRKIARTGEEVSAYTDTGLSSATTYFYRVTALIVGGEAPPSDVVSATTPIAPPIAPELTTETTPSGIVLMWTDVADETGYRIDRLREGDTDWSTIATTGEGVTLFEDGGLSPGATYLYRIVATGVGGDSEPSNVATATASVVTDTEPPGEAQGDPLPPEEPDVAPPSDP